MQGSSGAGEGYRIQQLTPFAPVRSRLDLVTDMLRDFVPLPTRTAANSRKVVVWDEPSDSFVLSGFERPAPTTALPARFNVGQRYITTQELIFNRFYEINGALSGDPAIVSRSGKFGPGNAWEIINFSNAVTLDSAIRGRTILRRDAGGSPSHIEQMFVDDVYYDPDGLSSRPNDYTLKSAHEVPIRSLDVIGSHRVILKTDNSPLRNAIASTTLPPPDRYEPGDWTAIY